MRRPARIPIPVRASVRDLLTDLLQRPVTVQIAAEPQSLSAGQFTLAASYAVDDGTPTAIAVFDLPLVIGAGSAFLQTSPGAAAASVETGALDDDIREAFHEVVNVMAKLLNSAVTPHVRLGGMHALPGDVPVGVAAVALEPAARADYRVLIEGYPGGIVTVLAS